MRQTNNIFTLAPPFLAKHNSQVHGSVTMCVFSVSRHFFKTNVTQSIAELILYSQKHEIVAIFYRIW